MYYLIYQEETDGEILIKDFKCRVDLYKFIKDSTLTPYDYALIEGKLMKDFTKNVHLTKGIE